MNISKEIDIVLLVADLSGYTALTEAHGNISAAKIVNQYLKMVHEVLHPDARLVERVGDEVLISAANASSVLQTAIRLLDIIEQEPFFPSVHIGIHAGRVLEQNGHYFGTAINLTSRIAAHARGGQILCTEQIAATADLDNVEYRFLGLTRFKNINTPVTIFEVVVSGQKSVVNLLDPVCYMQVRPETAPAKLPFGGKTYYFCSFDCAKIFANGPDNYAKGLTPDRDRFKKDKKNT